jgi:hypothetical protein
MMKRIWLIVLLACISTAAMSAPPDGPLEVVISHPESTKEAESGVVIFTMTNRSDAPIYVLKSLTPFLGKGERLTNNLLDVMDGHGKRAKYTSMYVGEMVNKDGSLDEKSFIRMNSGDSLSRKIDLSKSYDLSAGGAYTVRFNRPVVGEATRNDRGVARLEQADFYSASNTLDIWINVTLLPQDKTFGALDTKESTVCEAPKQAVIDAAMSKAENLSASATQYNASLWYYEGEGETFTAKLKEDFRQNNWFGNYDANWRPLIDPDWFNTENFFPINIASAIAVRLGGPLSTRPMSFDCSCPPEWHTTETTAAVALANQKIGICPKFFELDDTGFDTKAGALIHEAAHFSDDLAEGMTDIVYGTGNASKLAKDNPSEAKRNADNYKFFIESGGL